MKKIYEDNTWYSLLRYVTDFWIRGSFKRIRYAGLENIPKDGAVIFAPNHCDALMDPLAVLAMNRDKKVFVARADIFKKPFLEKVLTFLKIMPIHRVRDGFRNVAHTEETIEKSVEVLNNRVPFCILPEGAHRSMHSLLPLGKGLSRIACRADREKTGDGHIYIVPVGCEYGDYYRYRSTLLMTIGQPIDVTEYIAAHPEKAEPELYSDLRSLTAREMKKYIVFIPDDEDYPATWEISKLMSGHISEFRLQRRLEANRKTVERIGRLREDKPEKARKLFEKALAFAQARRDASVSIHATYSKHPLGAALWRTAQDAGRTAFRPGICHRVAACLGAGRTAVGQGEGPDFPQLFPLRQRCVPLDPAAADLDHRPLLHAEVVLGAGRHDPDRPGTPAPVRLDGAGATLRFCVEIPLQRKIASPEK